MEINFNSPCHVYFIGIGGISMSGLASILLSRGYKVSGSDRTKSELTKDLEASGAKIYYGQEESHITEDVDFIVYTAAIREGNPEYDFMMSSGIPHMTRAEFLGQLMKLYNVPIAVSGTHGKTTTTSMISEILLGNDCDPTLSNGGIIQSIGSNIRVGGPEYFLFEACEYTNSFLSFFPKISVILNIEEDHLDFFKDIDDIRNSFAKFAALLPSDGLLVINGEIEGVERILGAINCPYVTYGSTDKYDYYPSDITYDEMGHPSFICHVKKTGESFSVKLGVTGMHNVLNSLASIAVAFHLGLDIQKTTSALTACSGSKRRFEIRGSFDGVTVVDDYAHHPTEIEATLKAARNYPHNDLWVVFQPHTYTRTKAFLKDFVKALSLANHVVVAKTYEAREKDIYGVNSVTLYDELKKIGVDCYYFSTFEEIEKFLHKNCVNGDLLITMGAGDVVNIADSLTS